MGEIKQPRNSKAATVRLPKDKKRDEAMSDLKKDENGWISVNDGLPLAGKDMLITNEFDEWVSIGYKTELSNEWYNSYDAECPCYPTHWQPLPNQPLSNQ